MEKQIEGDVVVAVDIGTTKVCTIISEIINDEIKIIGVGVEKNYGMDKGGIVNITETANAVKKSIKKAEDIAKLEVDYVITSVSGKHISGISGHGEVSISNTKQKEITENDIERVVRMAADVKLSPDIENLHVIPLEYTVDYQEEVINPLGMTGMKLKVDAYVINASITAVDNIRKAIEKAGYKVENIILQILASGESVLYRDEKDIGVLLIDIGGGTTDIGIYYKGNLRFTKIVPLGGRYITKDLAKGLHVSYDEAERIKKDKGLIYYDKEDEDINDEEVEVLEIGGTQSIKVKRYDLIKYMKPRVYEIIEYIKGELDREKVDETMYSGGIVLTGGSALLKGIDKLFTEEFGIRTRIGFPLQEKITGLSDIINKPEYATAIGLIQYYINSQEINDKFLQEKGFFKKFLMQMKKIISEYI